MSLSLGEKLRQAREERGFTIVEVAEQTRISPLYLESIENDDYRILPGGIFNKGFVKSYAKFVGIHENEALADYSALISQTTDAEDEDSLKVYRPEVLTDDRSGSSMLPTVILAAVILGIMTAGILFLVNYLRKPEEPVPAANSSVASNANTTAQVPAEQASPTPATDTPTMETVKVEFRAVNEPVSLSATSDGVRSSNIINPGTPAAFEPKESLKLSYSRSLASNVELTINGKKITLPAQPLVRGRNSIEFDINKDNLAQIWSTGSISADVPPATAAEPANTEVPATTTTTPAPAPTTPRPTPARPATTPNPAANTAARPTPARTPATQPTRPVVVVPSANRP